MDSLAPSIGEQRVHVVPLGYEHDRIVESLRRTGADLVYLLVDDPHRTRDEDGEVDFAADFSSAESEPADWSAATDYQRGVRAAVAQFATVRGIPVRISDFYDVMGVVTTVAAEHSAGEDDGDRVFVNISTGPRIAAVGAAVACMSVGIRPYSVEPEEHVHDVDSEPLTTGLAGVDNLPIYPIDAPSRDQISVLRYLREKADRNHTTDKRTIIKHFEANAGLDCLQGTDDKSWNAKYNRLDNRVLKEMIEKGYVEIDPVGRSHNVHITQSGRNVYTAFKHVLDD